MGFPWIEWMTRKTARIYDVNNHRKAKRPYPLPMPRCLQQIASLKGFLPALNSNIPWKFMVARWFCPFKMLPWQRYIASFSGVYNPLRPTHRKPRYFWPIFLESKNPRFRRNLWETTTLPIPSMYMYLNLAYFYGKCRPIYHTWILSYVLDKCWSFFLSFKHEQKRQ